ncbi:cytochrome P450 [Streptomyces sp. NPDC048527]|uniref:cytochrome P450 n=1 Tax=Streptomyces sp. NPDC048527 TaxID=3365568 RepID=UPI00371C9AB4
MITHTSWHYPFPARIGREKDPRLAQLREQGTMSKVVLPYGGEAWLAVRHSDAKVVMTDRRFSRAAALDPERPRPLPEQPTARSTVDLDPPDHTELRRLMAPVFSREAVEALRPQVRELVEKLVVDLRTTGGVTDFVQTFALPLPVAVIGDFLGVPEAEKAEFSELVTALMGLPGPVCESWDCELAERLEKYLTRLISLRRRDPGHDLISRLVSANDEGGGIWRDDCELITQCIFVLGAGYLTVSGQLASHLFLLLSDRRLWDAVTSGAVEVDSAVEELLRATSFNNGTGFPRVALEDVSVGGVTVRAGETVFIAINSANHDSEVFDQPEGMDLSRSPNPHVAFGLGIHHCAGAGLARMELQEALRALREVPDLRLAVPAEDVPWRGSAVHAPKALPVFIRMPSELPVTISAG